MRSAQRTAHDALKIFWINKSSQPSKDPDKEKETLKRIIIKKVCQILMMVNVEEKSCLNIA